ARSASAIAEYVLADAHNLLSISQMTPNLSIVLPVYNEVDSLERVLSEWDASLRGIPGLRHVFVVCEDGSTDGTKELIIELEHRYLIVSNSAPWRRGYSQAVRAGIGISETEYVLCIDSDGQIAPDQMSEAWDRRSEDHFLIGWRYPRSDPSVRLVYSKLIKSYHRLLFPNRLHDPSCPFVLGRTKLFERVAPLLVYMDEGFWWGFVG